VKTLFPALEKWVGEDRIKRMRKAFSKIGQMLKRILKRFMAKHMRTGLIYTAIGYKQKYNRLKDSISVSVGVRSDEEITTKYGKRYAKNYATLLETGRRAFVQALRQPPFCKRRAATGMNAHGPYFRFVGSMKPLFNLSKLADNKRDSIFEAAFRAIGSVPNPEQISYISGVVA
jgi:hypothetical protein